MMNRYIFLIIFSLILISCEDRPVDWTPTYDSTHSIPYGTEVLRKELKNIFPDYDIENIQTNTLEYFSDYENYESNGHYVYINEQDLHDSETWQTISNYVFEGGSAFISITTNNSVFLNDLGISIESMMKVPEAQTISATIQTSQTEKKYSFQKVFNTEFISNYNTETTDVLGYVNYNGKREPNLVKIFHGNGYIIFSTTPTLFTNFQMLRNNNAQYAVNVFSYMENSDIKWDNHRIDRRSSGEKNDGGFFNGLKFLMQHESLRWAFFLLVGLGLLYLIFNSKRKQKAIPIILPYQNYTLDFAKTLSELYRHNPDHTAMVRYKINYFLEQIRQKYHITSKDTEKDYSQILSSKSGVDLATCQKIVATINLYKSKSVLERNDFYQLQSLIHLFNQKSQAYARSNNRF